MRLIDADALIAYIKKRIRNEMVIAWLCKIIGEVPTIEAEPVVRCKDCKHWMKDVPGCTDFVGRCCLANYMIGATGYCVYVERMSYE